MASFSVCHTPRRLHEVGSVCVASSSVAETKAGSLGSFGQTYKLCDSFIFSTHEQMLLSQGLICRLRLNPDEDYFLPRNMDWGSCDHILGVLFETPLASHLAQIVAKLGIL